MGLSPAELIARKLQQAGELPDLARPEMACSCGGGRNPGRISRDCAVHGFMLAKTPPATTPQLLRVKQHFEAGLDEVTGGEYPDEWVGKGQQ